MPVRVGSSEGLGVTAYRGAAGRTLTRLACQDHDYLSYRRVLMQPLSFQLLADRTDQQSLESECR